MSWSWDSTQIDFSQTCWTFDGSNTCGASAGDKVKQEKTKWDDYLDFDKVTRDKRKAEDEAKHLLLKERAKTLLAKPEFDGMSEADKLFLLEEEDLKGLIVLLLLI